MRIRLAALREAEDTTPKKCETLSFLVEEDVVGPLKLATGQLLGFGVLAWWIRKHPVVPVDMVITREVQKRQSPVLDQAVHVLSYGGGKSFIVAAMALPIATLLWRVRRRLEAVMLVTTCVSSATGKNILQRIVCRPRPSAPLVRVMEEPDGPSFPSGHVVAASSFWGWLFVLGQMLLKGKQDARKALLAIPLFFLLITGPTRIYMGDHWTSDVLGGYLFGGGWFNLSLSCYRFLKKRNVLAD